MEKIIFIVLLMGINSSIFSQQPLERNMKIGEEIWFDGRIVLFNGWPPNIRMIIQENNVEYITGIEEETVPDIVMQNLFKGTIRGTFNLKLLARYNIVYYNSEILVFRIIEYRDIKIEYRN